MLNEALYEENMEDENSINPHKNDELIEKSKKKNIILIINKLKYRKRKRSFFKNRKGRRKRAKKGRIQ